MLHIYKKIFAFIPTAWSVGGLIYMCKNAFKKLHGLDHGLGLPRGKQKLMANCFLMTYIEN